MSELTSVRRLSFCVVDVFAVEPLTGNPLAVVECDDGLPIELYRRIAREFNQAETTFVLAPSRPEADRRLRSFTAAGVEVFGAGHNALGAWCWLAQAGRLPPPRSAPGLFRQEIGDQVLPLTIEGEHQTARIAMRQEPPAFGQQLPDSAPLAAALGVDAGDIVSSLPCQVVSTGAPHLMVPLRTQAAVDRCLPDARALLAVLASVEAEGCYVFTRETRQPGTSAYARFFNPTVGIAEDPATGTAAGPLAAYLVRHGEASEGALVIEQGTAMGRTSLIQIDLRGDAVTISGQGVIVAIGELMV